MSAQAAAPAAGPTTSRLQDLALSFQKSAAFMAAIDLGLFDAISRGTSTIADLATELELTTTNVERLLVVLLALGLVVRDERGVLYNATDVERFLVAGKRDYAGPWLLFTRPRWDEWGRLTDHLRSHEHRRLGLHTEALDIPSARKYHYATYSVGLGAGRRFARHVDLSGCRRLLDLGGGSGAYSIVAAEKHPQLEAVVFDLPVVTEVTREFVSRARLGDRIRTVAGDFTRDPLPQGFDVVLMASNLPMYSREIIGKVVAKAFGALEPGGEMHLIGEMLDDDGCGPIGPALWGLAEALQESTGLAHTRADCRGYLEAAGFVEIEETDFVPGVLTRTTGRKPAAASRPAESGAA